MPAARPRILVRGDPARGRPRPRRWHLAKIGQVARPRLALGLGTVICVADKLLGILSAYDMHLGDGKMTVGPTGSETLSMRNRTKRTTPANRFAISMRVCLRHRPADPFAKYTPTTQRLMKALFTKGLKSRKSWMSMMIIRGRCRRDGQNDPRSDAVVGYRVEDHQRTGRGVDPMRILRGRR